VPDSKRIAGKTYRVYLGVNLKRAETYHDAD
jgi:hypothetical protein